jgi:hypothetical protein
MLRLDKVIKPWKESAALNDHINLYGFWNETAFLTKSGDLGMVLSVPGVDYESLDRSEQEYAVKRLEAALKAFGPGFHVYQYLFKSNRPDIPFATYDDPIVAAAIDQRRKFFEAKRDHLYQIEIFYCILLEGARSKTGVGTALARLFRDPEGAIAELKSQFTNDSMKKLLRAHLERDLQRLDQHVQAFVRQLADFMQIEVLNRQGQFSFFRRLLNYDDWRVAGRPQSTQFLDYQVVNSDIEAERDHLRVGARVTAAPSAKEVSDVLDVLLFLNRFLNPQNREIFFDRLASLVSGVAALVDREQRPLFRSAFDYLRSINLSAKELYSDMLRLLFNAPTAGTLRVNWLRGTDGELALHVGENGPFGVVNIGDPKNLFDQCRDEPSLNASEQELSGSLFSTINAEQSPINILVGAKKFSEGWNSFRVTTLGLMNVGKSEGAQIIQLFGRGVRLWGKDFTLKRSKALHGKHPKHLPRLETLYVFGLKADYMDRFRDFLDAEGVPVSTIELSVPIVKRAWPQCLRVMRPIGFDFRESGLRPALGTLPGEKGPRVVLDWYPRVFALRAADDGLEETKATKNEGKLTSAHLAFLNIDAIYFELQQLKSEKGWYNLSISRSKVEELLYDQSWYTLYVPPDLLEFRDFGQVRVWGQIAAALLKKYCERFYNYKKSAAEAPHLKYVELTPDDDNFIENDQYLVRLEDDNASLQNQLEDLRETISRLRDAIRLGDFTGIALEGFGSELKPLFVREHLYHPLIFADGVEVTPVALNDRAIILNSFILSRTPFNQISWMGAGVTKQEVQDRNVLFLEDGGSVYLQQLFSKLFQRVAEP